MRGLLPFGMIDGQEKGLSAQLLILFIYFDLDM